MASNRRLVAGWRWRPGFAGEIDFEETRTRTAFAEDITRVRQSAEIKGEAAAANAEGELVAEPNELFDALIQVGSPPGRKRGPLGSARWLPRGQRVERGPNLGQRDPDPLRNTNERDAP